MARGRPSSFKPDYIEQARNLCELGATEEDLARAFKVTTRTISRWQVTYKDFCLALKMGKAATDERVERSLYRRATGYTFDSEKIFQSDGRIIRAKTKEHVPPDTTAMIFWLKNRRPEAWRDRREVTGKDGAPIESLTEPRGLAQRV